VSVTDLLAQLNEKNVTLSLRGDELVVHGKKRALAPSLLALLRENKKALLELIKAGEYIGPRDAVIDVPPNLIPPGSDVITPEMLPLAQLSKAEIEQIVVRVPGSAANVQDIYPLTPLQEGMLFHHLMESEGDVYLTPELLSFDTRERLERFLQALQAVIDRHDILRTAVQWEGLREPVQVVWRRAPLVVEEAEIELTNGDVAEELYARYDPRRNQLDIRVAPLMRVYIANDVRKGRWVMLNLFHHLVIDHTAFEVLLEEIRAHLLDRVEQLPEPLPFRNFVVQARLGVSQEEHEAFFRGMLGDVDEPTAPYGLIDVQKDGAEIREAWRGVDMQLCVRLRQRARALRLAAASLYHQAWALVLARVSGRDDVVFGTILFGRMQGGEGADRVLGMLINTLPVRIRVGDESVEESVQQTHRLLTQLLRHEQAPLALAQRCSAVEAPTPLFTALFNYRHSAAAETTAGAADEMLQVWEGVELLRSEERSNYPFGLIVDDLGEGFLLKVQAQSPIDPDRICSYLHIALEQLVEALEHAPATPMRNLDVLPASERHQLLVEWNETGRLYPQDRTIHELLAEQAERTPERIALVSERQAMSYRDLNLRANQLGHYLRRLGVGPEVVVGVCLGRSVEMVVAVLGVLKAGGAYLPLDADSPLERLSFMLEDAGAGVVLTEQKLERRLPAFWGQTVLMDAGWERIGEERDSEPESEAKAENLAYVIYTSGSTGRPKGVMVAHRGLCNLVEVEKRVFGLGERSRVFQFASLSFDASVWEIFSALAAGGSLHVYARERTMPGDELVSILKEDQITMVTLPPTALEALAQEELSNLQTVIAAGEACTAEIVEKWAVGRKFFDAYGPTEATVCVTMSECEAGHNRRPTIGRPIANAQVYILDREMKPAPVGVRGDMYLSGVGVARGYLGRPELTAERFVPNPFGDEGRERLYQTGDVARYLSDGSIEFIGRADDQIKVRGYRIELGEIEAVLNEHRSVRRSAVVAEEDENRSTRLVGYVAGGDGVTVAELKRHVRERLPEYMVPESIMMLEEMPVNANGKIDRKRLPSIKDAGRQPEQEYVAPRTPVEELVASIFEEVLKVDRVSVHDDFFKIGGHSLLATQVTSRVRSIFKLEIRVGNIFEAATVETLAKLLIAKEPKPGQTEKIAAIINKLGHMTEADADAELANLN
jgi:amino acid adenylation domain-containing protein